MHRDHYARITLGCSRNVALHRVQIAWIGTARSTKPQKCDSVGPSRGDGRRRCIVTGDSYPGTTKVANGLLETAFTSIAGVIVGHIPDYAGVTANLTQSTRCRCWLSEGIAVTGAASALACIDTAGPDCAFDIQKQNVGVQYQRAEWRKQRSRIRESPHGTT